jgi:hypothetical protein
MLGLSLSAPLDLLVNAHPLRWIALFIVPFVADYNHLPGIQTIHLTVSSARTATDGQETVLSEENDTAPIGRCSCAAGDQGEQRAGDEHSLR